MQKNLDTIHCAFDKNNELCQFGCFLLNPFGTIKLDARNRVSTFV